MKLSQFLTHKIPQREIVVGCITGDKNFPIIRGRDWRLWDSLDRKYAEKRIDKDIFCLSSFQCATRPITRMKVYDEIKDKKGYTFHNMGLQKEWQSNKSTDDSNQFYNLLRRSKFCISPVGHGVDCFRTYDALYEKSIPVIGWDPNPLWREWQETHLTDLPIIFVETYEVATKIFLNEQYNKMLDKSYNIAKLKFSYWAKHEPKLAATKLTKTCDFQKQLVGK